MKRQTRPSVPSRSEDGKSIRPEPRLDRIARRAYEIYQARGGTDGQDLGDWLQAEREIDAESDDVSL